MKPIRFYFALYVSKAALLLMKLLGKNATYLPGKVAIKLCKDFLGCLTPPKTVIAVSGTNGKTTVSNLITATLRANGYRVTNNSTGTNIQAGIVTALLEDATLTGRPKKDIAVLEVDERSSILVYSQLKPDYLVCNNIMQDSIRRNAHPEFIRYIIQRELPASTKLILNADDLICSDLAPQCENRTYFGVEAEIPADTDAHQAFHDIVYCPDCGAPLAAEYLRYDHIGRMYCTGCGKRSPEPDFRVTAIDREQATITVRHDGVDEAYRLFNDNIINIYNVCGTIALLSRLGLSYAQIRKGFDGTQIVKSRYDCQEVEGRSITMLMAKGQSPMACTRSLSYAAKIPVTDKRMILMVDDKHENIRHSESTCWLYDCDYSYLADPSISRIIFAGPRCRDHYLRALIAGIPEDKLRITDSYDQIPGLVELSSAQNIFILYEVGLVDEAQAVSNALADVLRKERGAK